MIKYIEDVYPKKAQFIKNERVEILIELNNPTERSKNLTIHVRVLRLVEEVENIIIHMPLAPFERKKHSLTLAPKNDDFEGYGVDIEVYEAGSTVQSCSTSFDVVSCWQRATRYGFLSDFNAEERGDREDVEFLLKFHLNLVQFYDWMYRHDTLVPPTAEFADSMGRTLNLDVVKEKIAYCREAGMKAVAYGAIYAASPDFYGKNADWGFYTSSGNVYDFINRFRIMNFAPDSPWHRHIIEEYKKAITEVGFDGIHMDTYGFPKTAVSKLEGREKIERLEELFPILINDTREALQKVHPDVCLIFNNVGNWPVDTVGDAEQDAVYIEVWEPYERYHQIQQIIKWAKVFGKGKPVILAAYLKPFRKDSSCEEKEARYSALFLTSIIAANGGYHLLLGGKEGILTQGYYADYSRIKGDFVRQLRDYYDFIVRYSKVLFDNALRDVSMTHCGGDNLEYVFSNTAYSLYGEPDKVFVVIREKPELKVISFINLTNNREDYWNKGKQEPAVQKDILVDVQISREPKNVFLATPDNNGGKPVLLDYLVEDSNRGKVLKVKVAELYIWSLLVLDFGENGKL